MSDETIRTRIWREEPEPDNPFAARAAYCHGYDVYGDMLGRARWSEMLYLLFRGEAPSAAEVDLLEALAVALANPGPRDPSVHAAMCGGVCGSAAAASLMAALAAGAGGYGGAREVHDAMLAWSRHGTDLTSWRGDAVPSADEAVDIWAPREHPPGFDPHGVSASTIVRQVLDGLAAASGTPYLSWLSVHRESLEAATGGLPLALTGVAAAALADLGFSPAQGEMLYLLLRLPGAAAHALEQEGHGFRNFPFYTVELADDPAMPRAAGSGA